MTTFFKTIQKNKKKFDNIENKINKCKKDFSFFKPINSFLVMYKTKYVKENFILISFVIISSILLMTLHYFYYYNKFFLIAFGILSFISSICFFKDILKFFIAPKIFKKTFSQKEIFITQNYENNIESIFIYTLKRFKVNKENFKDIVSVYNQNKNNLDNYIIFDLIKSKLIKNFNESHLSAKELKKYIQYFIINLNIDDQEKQREVHSEIEGLTFNDINDYNKNNNIFTVVF